MLTRRQKSLFTKTFCSTFAQTFSCAILYNRKKFQISSTAEERKVLIILNMSVTAL